MKILSNSRLKPMLPQAQFRFDIPDSYVPLLSCTRRRDITGIQEIDEYEIGIDSVKGPKGSTSGQADWRTDTTPFPTLDSACR